MYEKGIVFNALPYSIWYFYFSRQVLKERTTPARTLLITVITFAVIIFAGRQILPRTIPVFIFVHSAINMKKPPFVSKH